MKEAIGGTWLFNIVIFFLLLFAGYMCLSINYSKAFNVKDKIINEIERNGGVSFTGDMNRDDALKSIKEYITKVGYRTTGNCEGYDYGCDRDGICSKVISNSEYLYCIKEEKAKNNYKAALENEFVYISYYKVKVFYQLDLPVMKSLFRFEIKGDTKLLYDEIYSGNK